MIVTTILLARAIRSIEQRTAIYVPDLVETVQSRYGFVRFPMTPREVLPAANTIPLVFEHGKFEHEGRSILIQRLELYSYAVTVDAPNTTDDADLVADDLLSAGGDFVQPAARRFYISQIELTHPGIGIPVPDRAIPAIGTVARELARTLPLYEPAAWPNGASPADFAVPGFSLLIDPGVMPLACDFRLERRANTPFRDNLFYSQAPLRTHDHATALEAFFKVRDEEAARASASSSEQQPPSSR